MPPFQRIPYLVSFRLGHPNFVLPILILHNESHATKERTGNSLPIGMSENKISKEIRTYLQSHYDDGVFGNVYLLDLDNIKR